MLGKERMDAGFAGFKLKRGTKRGAPAALGGQDAKRKAANLLGDQVEPSATAGPSRAAGGASDQTLVIPKQVDTFVPGVGDRRFNAERYLPEKVEDELEAAKGADMGKKFVTDEALREEEAKVGGGQAEKDEKTKPAYGLEVRRRNGGPESASQQQQQPTSSGRLPGRGGPGNESEEETLRRDLDSLPEEIDARSDRYVAMPVEEFGRAMMRGMGWSEGKGVGRNAKEDVKVVEFLSRPDRLGLGAQPKAEVAKPKWINKPGEEKGKGGRQKVLMAAADDTGRVRHTRHLDEKMVAYVGPGVQVGKTMAVIAGKHEGLQCAVLEVLPRERGRSEYARVRLTLSEKVVDIRCKELADRPVTSRAQPEQAAGGAGGKRKAKPSGSHGGSSSSKARPWLYTNLRVRIVDKRLSKGKAYLKKAVITDVVTPLTCDLAMDDSAKKRVSAVDQRSLETVVPKAQGARLVVVRGQERGRKCALVKRKTSEGVATVQFASDFTVRDVSLDDVCEYVGEDDEDVVL